MLRVRIISTLLSGKTDGGLRVLMAGTNLEASCKKPAPDRNRQKCLSPHTFLLKQQVSAFFFVISQQVRKEIFGLYFAPSRNGKSAEWRDGCVYTFLLKHFHTS